jgi:hypothetical protein
MMSLIQPTVVEYVKILRTSNSLVGQDGRPVSENNPPDRKIGDVAEIRQIGLPQFCCGAMSYHFGFGAVAFGQRPEEVYRNKLAEVFLRVENGSQVLSREGSPPPKGQEWKTLTYGREPKPNEDIALAYCPWCTQSVMTREIATI